MMFLVLDNFELTHTFLLKPFLSIRVRWVVRRTRDVKIRESLDSLLLISAVSRRARANPHRSDRNVWLSNCRLSCSRPVEPVAVATFTTVAHFNGHPQLMERNPTAAHNFLHQSVTISIVSRGFGFGFATPFTLYEVRKALNHDVGPVLRDKRPILG